MKLKAGDLIKMSRKNKDYYQFGIYIGQEEVIHYVETPKIKGKVMKTTLKEFRKKSGIIQLVTFPETKEGRATLVQTSLFFETEGLFSKGTWPEWYLSHFDEYIVNTRKETIHRAKNKLGKSGELKFNNGEHFIWWCKTDMKRTDKTISRLDEFFNPLTPMARLPLSKRPAASTDQQAD